jgi:hypothetical protein
MFVHRQRDHAHLLAKIVKPLAHCHHALGQCANLAVGQLVLPFTEPLWVLGQILLEILWVVTFLSTGDQGWQRLRATRQRRSQGRTAVRVYSCPATFRAKGD